MNRTSALEADLATTEGAGNIPGQTVVGIPPSSVDVLYLMRVRVLGALVTRPFDPVLEQP